MVEIVRCLIERFGSLVANEIDKTITSPYSQHSLLELLELVYLSLVAVNAAVLFSSRSNSATAVQHRVALYAIGWGPRGSTGRGHLLFLKSAARFGRPPFFLNHFRLSKPLI